ncbi:TerD family protein [Streptomyces sp. NPDC008139]|uniref:TerD family protein n=1 Tax=Streptomyces sp. NPDC008139 TaxID=3364814 RepID=UPI0036E47531
MTGMTHVMVKGSNTPLDAPGIRAVLRWTPASGSPDVDASVLLLGSNGKVRSDADFVFYNEPRHPSGLARHLPKKRVSGSLTDTVEVDLAALGSDVDRVVIVASCDGGPFAQVQDLCVLLYDTTGPQHAPVITFEVRPDTGYETALNCGEIYRKDGGWKFRALGQGYDTGLVGVATEFGIAVDDVEGGDSDRTAVPATTAPPTVSPAAPPTAGPVSQQTAPYAQEPEPAPTSAYGYPLQAPSPGHVPAQPAYGYPQPVAATTAPPVHQQPQQGYPAYGYPQPVAAAAAANDGSFQLPPQGPQFQSGS